MKARTSLFSLLLLTAVSGVAAQSLPRDAVPLTTRPLNLSVRKPNAPLTDPALIVIGQPAQSTSPTQNVTAGSNEETGGAASLPYGAGFESRQQGSATGGGSTGGAGNSGNSGSGNGAGTGGGGRGGAGRGR